MTLRRTVTTRIELDNSHTRGRATDPKPQVLLRPLWDHSRLSQGEYGKAVTAAFQRRA
jgi:hypothetical protein